MSRIVDIVGTIAQNFNIGNATVFIDENTGSLESSIGYGLKNSKYVSNIILSMQQPLSYLGLVVTLPANVEMNISNGRDIYNSTTNPDGNGCLKSTYVKTSTSTSLTLTALGSGVTKEYDVFYKNSSTPELVVFETDKIISEISSPNINLYDVWRDTNNNLFYVKSGSNWVVTPLIKVGSLVLTAGTITSLTPEYPCDLSNVGAYLKSMIASSLSWKRQSIAASSSTTSSINLNGVCKNVNNMIVLIEHTEIPSSAYTLNSTGTVLSFNEAVPAGLRIDLRWL